MKLTLPVYAWKTDGGMTIQYDSMTRDDALNFTGPTWIDCKLGLVRNLISTHPVVLCDNDLLAHDDYIAKLIDTGCLVVLVYNDKASKLRLKRAKDKLRQAGISVRYCANMQAAERFIYCLKDKE